MVAPQLHARFAAEPLTEALEDSPVVLIHGPRQCGKTTLAQLVCAPQALRWRGNVPSSTKPPNNAQSADGPTYDYLSFDDHVTRAGAEVDPMGFVADLPERVVLDEVQRVPALFSALKLAVDRDRTPGRFLLTGSTNVLLVPTLSDSLAGRMQIVRLHPLAQCELASVEAAGGPDDFLNALFHGAFTAQRVGRLGNQLVERIVAGGYPAALALLPGRRRANWYRNYLDALVQRDVRDLARISDLDALHRLLALAAAQSAQLLNISDLASPFQVSRPTINNYVTLLERIFLLDRLPPWHSNRTSRLIKSPKLHFGDTGLACALLGVDAAALAKNRELLGQLLETFVLQELRRQASWWNMPSTFHHYRDKDQVEVDIVIERGALAVAGVEVKAGATVRNSDFRGLRKLATVAGSRFKGGVVLYDGEACVSFGDGLYAVPIRLLWETARPNDRV